MPVVTRYQSRHRIVEQLDAVGLVDDEPDDAQDPKILDARDMRSEIEAALKLLQPLLQTTPSTTSCIPSSCSTPTHSLLSLSSPITQSALSTVDAVRPATNRKQRLRSERAELYAASRQKATAVEKVSMDTLLQIRRSAYVGCSASGAAPSTNVYFPMGNGYVIAELFPPAFHLMLWTLSSVKPLLLTMATVA